MLLLIEQLALQSKMREVIEKKIKHFLSRKKLTQLLGPMKQISINLSLGKGKAFPTESNKTISRHYIHP